MLNENTSAAPAAPQAGPSLFVPGRNCWRVARARRAAMLVDGAAYFEAFAQAALRAERSILILAWDFNSGAQLLMNPRDTPSQLGDFLNFLVRRRRDLEVRVLIWDYPMIFGADREFPPIYGLGWKPHRRVIVRYDNTHPFTGSHHQKVVVIDDRLAFCGGLDLTCRRWDTPEHLPSNPHRVCEGKPYPPFHDVMLMVDGEAARALGTLARDRWSRATGSAVPVASRTSDPWPPGWPATFEDVDVAISRTLPLTEDRCAVREIEQLHLDMIAAARHSIYIENQYFTADAVGDALAARLGEPEGPEIVVVLRRLSHGWLEEVTMQTLRSRLIARLRAADVHGRLSILYPHVDGLEPGTCIDVHSKVLVVDDEYLRVGSANLCNRSMGFDTECDLTIEAGGRPDTRQAIRECRQRLIAEHLGVEREEVAAAEQESGSMAGAIARLRGGPRTLLPLEETAEKSEAVLSLASLGDPEAPVTLDKLIAQFAPRVELRQRFSLLTRVLAAIALIGGLAALWRFTPLASVITAERVTAWANEFAHRPWAPAVVLLAYPISSIVMFPRPLITLFAVVAFGAWLGFAYAMAGVLLAAFLSYVAGMRWDRDTVRRFGGPKLNRVIEVLRTRGLVAITALRLVPLAPFAVEGVVAGAIRIPLWQFMTGTALGMLPGTLTATVFGEQLENALTGRGHINYWLVGGMVLLLVAGALVVRRWLLTAQLEHVSPPVRR